MKELKCPHCGRIFKCVDLPVEGTIKEITITCNKCHMEIKYGPSKKA